MRIARKVVTEPICSCCRIKNHCWFAFFSCSPHLHLASEGSILLPLITLFKLFVFGVYQEAGVSLGWSFTCICWLLDAVLWIFPGEVRLSWDG